METLIAKRVEEWKKLLLDYSRRNRLYCFRSTKRTSLEISLPEYGELYSRIALNNETLQFAYSDAESEEDDAASMQEADIVTTSKSLKEQQKSLYAIRQRAKSAFDEQGVNVLYLIIGLLRWTPQRDSEDEINSPLLLVPVQISCTNLTSPFKLSLNDSEEVLLNPTLKHKLLSDYGISIPDFDPDRDDLEAYLDRVEEAVSGFGGLCRCVHLTLLSFLKMSMHEDLHKNGKLLSTNPHIRSICGARGIKENSDSWSFGTFDHDNGTRPHEVFHILDADSSQMDAILAAKRGMSFVLKGPPGTGKSQTIANIISESMANGKKVLFVSEKRAALEVVYNRLQRAGLGDFCFALHNHKANRRQMLGQLQEVMNKAVGKNLELNVNQLNVLERKRKELNRYHNELHTHCSGFDKSAFQMIGKLANLSDVPDVIFDIPNVETLTEEYIDEKCELLRRLASVIGKRSADYEHNCWRCAVAENFTQTLIHEIDAHLIPLGSELRSLRDALAAFHVEHQNEIECTVGNLSIHEHVLQVASRNPGIISYWIDLESISELVQSSYQWENIIDESKQKRLVLESEYSPEFFCINPTEYLRFFNSGVGYLTNFFKVEDIDSFISTLDKKVQDVDSVRKALDSVYSEASTVSCALGLEKPNTRRELHRLVELCEVLKDLPAIPDVWFDSSVFEKVKKYTPAHSFRHERVHTLEKQIRQNYNIGVFQIDYQNLIRRFRTEYCSFLKFFKPSYYRDLKEIKAHYRNTTSLKNEQIHALLNALEERDDLLKKIGTDSPQLSNLYGSLYCGIQSDWEKIKNTVGKFEKIIEHLVSIPDDLKLLLLRGELPTATLSHLLSTWQSIVPVKQYTLINDICNNPISQDRAYDDYSKQFEQVVSFAVQFLSYYTNIAKWRRTPETYSQILQEVETLQRLFECEQYLKDNKERLEADYGFYYKELDTKWDSIRNALEYSSELKAVVEQYGLSSSFVTHLCSDFSMAQQCKELLEYVKNGQEAIEEDLKWYINMFPSNMQNVFYGMDLMSLAERVENCQINKHLLEEWIDFQSQHKRCVDAGLADYVLLIEKNKVASEHIVDAYLKRFYALWIDAIKHKFPALDNFRGNIHEKLIQEFKELDELQMKIAVKRIQQKMWNSLPDFRVQYSRKDEVAVLKRECLKKTRLMTLRRLLGEIPNLAMSLKPCFMMSPLSVSIFLSSESYNFDLVIFDEASQVHTEDAIGAIMRGKQVIIVGDDKQLPPTSFFRATMSVDDLEDDDSDEYYSAASFESILSEAEASGFMEHSLRWHYRSRHEDLIAFSNMKLYDGKLVTFPSTTVKMPDCGVEFVHVPDGCYERQRSKGTNPLEAQKVAELVFAHLRKYGTTRSLGVVAFSESQQNAIEAAIIEHRRRDNMYEHYFNEDTEEAFFVKNLENVQGDERDTIIFSVGYAKDESGKMIMNFGPLNHKGGERRLNVAVTRAKHNVKLVSSILSTDIDLERTNADGVKLLRSYLEYAQQGVDSLIKKEEYNPHFVELDSPFEEAVYDYLTARGYQVQTQVGCSGYRIDMAVKHPSLKGKFAIGIECDGATYHSSRTARERDRLRQTVLEDMGWTIYRIWSTDWIKSPDSQGAKLEEAIRASFEKHTSAISCSSEKQPVGSDIVIQREPKNVLDLPLFKPVQPELSLMETANYRCYGFVNYEEAKLDPKWKQKNCGIAISRIIEIEQPIHINLLAKRLFPLYGRQKLTSAFRDVVEGELRKLPKSCRIRQVGDFLQFANFSELKVRVPVHGAERREVEYIPIPEIELAFVKIAQKTYGITKAELFKIAGQQFGFERQGDKIKDVFERAYKNVLRRKTMVEQDGKVSVTA